MRSVEEIVELRNRIRRIIDAVVEFGSREEIDSRSYLFLCNVADTLNWILEEISTETFISAEYLGLDEWMRREKELREEFL